MTTEPKNQVQIWAFETHDVRIHDRDGNPWFVAVDVCKIWGIKNSRDAVARLDDDEKDTVVITDSIGRDREVQVISESGLYAMAARSRMDAPKRFCKWVRSEVIPSIRKTGTYTMEGSAPPPQQVDPIALAAAIATAMQPVLLALANGQVEIKEKVSEVEWKVAEYADRISELEKIAPRQDYMTLVGYVRFKGLTVNGEDLKCWGGYLTSYCRRKGIETIKVPDARWYRVNSYPIQVIEETLPILGPKAFRRGPR